MATLTDEMKTFIVMGLARYDTPSAVARAVGSTFGVEVTRHQMHRYDPNCAEPPAPRWRELHAATRKVFLAQLAEVGVSHRAVRLRRLEEMANHAMDNHHFKDALAFLELAAKECGGIYDRHRYPAPPAKQPVRAASPGCDQTSGSAIPRAQAAARS